MAELEKRAQHQRDYYNSHKDDPEWAEKNRRQRRESYFRHREKRLAEMRLWRLQVNATKPAPTSFTPLAVPEEDANLTWSQSYYKRNADELKKKASDYYYRNKEKILEKMKATHIPKSTGKPKGRPPKEKPVPKETPTPKETPAPKEMPAPKKQKTPLKIKRRSLKELEKEIEDARKVKESLPKFEFKDAPFEMSFS